MGKIFGALGNSDAGPASDENVAVGTPGIKHGLTRTRTFPGMAGVNLSQTPDQPTFTGGSDGSAPQMSMPTGGALPNVGAQPQVSTTPSFVSALYSGPGGMPNALSPELTKAGKLLAILGLTAKGALAGYAAGQEGNPRQGYGGFGAGYQAASQLPFLQSLQKQQLQQGDAAIQNLPMQRQQQQATLENTQAQTDWHRAQAQKATQPPNVKAGTPDQQLLDYLTSTPDPQLGRPLSTAEAYQRMKQVGQDVKPVKNSPAKITYDAGIPVSVVDEKGTAYDINDPNLPDSVKPLVKSAQAAHSQKLKEAADIQGRAYAQQQAMFNARQDALTSSTKSMVEAAPKVLQLAARLKTLIDQQEQQLGPAASRWAEFMAGRVGSPNPEFTKLRTDAGLLQTLLMRMHVGSRGGEYIMKHFQDLLDTSKQSPANMRAALEEITQYAQDVEAEGGKGKFGGKSSPAQPQASQPQATHVYDPKTRTIQAVQ